MVWEAVDGSKMLNRGLWRDGWLCKEKCVVTEGC